MPQKFFRNTNYGSYWSTDYYLHSLSNEKPPLVSDSLETVLQSRRELASLTFLCLKIEIINYVVFSTTLYFTCWF